MNIHEMQGRLASKADSYAQAAEAAQANALAAAKRGDKASVVARLNGMAEVLQQAARDFAVLAES